VFLGLLGGSVGADATFSVPISSLRNLSLRGTQLTFSGSATPLAGVGTFAGFGPNLSLGSASEPMAEGWSSSSTAVVQFGAGDGGGVETSAAILQTDLSETVPGGTRGAIGAYGATGKKFSKNFTFGSGC
jgi:hypothetical protein